MSVVAIICEYNPFHNGHYYHMEQARLLASASKVLCIMSGSVVQRGEPAIFDKWARADMALSGGADVVAELPAIYAAASAQRFAKGALRLLDATGVVTHLAFGTEVTKPSSLFQLAELLASPPSSWQQDIKTGLSHGLSYATARLQATLKLIEKSKYHHLSSECRQIMSSPNNILGLEYLIALNQLESSIIPIPIPRKGADYHSLQPDRYPSATLIRNLLYNHTPLTDLKSMLPAETLDIINEQSAYGRGPVTLDQLDQLILYRLRNMSLHDIENLPDVEAGMGARIQQAVQKVGNREQLRHLIKTKRYTMTRIDRILLYSLLNITKTDVAFFDSNSPNYFRVLGCSASGQKILQTAGRKSDLLLINRVRPALNKMQKNSHPGTASLLLDLAATDLQALLFPACSQRITGQDFTHSPLIK